MKDAEIAALVDDAYEAMYAQNLRKTAELLDQIYRAAPNDRDAQLLEADLYEAQGLGEEAVAAIEQALSKHKDDPVLRFRFATLLLDIYEEVGDAREILEGVESDLQEGKVPDFGKGPEADKTVDDFRLEVLLALSDCRAADHDPRGALQAADAAVALAESDPMAQLTKAVAHFDLCEIEQAKASIERTLSLDSKLPDAHWWQGRIQLFLQEDEPAEKSLQKAIALAPERFQAPYRVSEDEFVRIAEESLAELPDRISKYLSNVVIAAETVPKLERLQAGDLPLSPGSLGLYEGTPPSLGHDDDPWTHFPSQITLFRTNIELSSHSHAELRAQIATTLLHEVGHYLGLDENDLDERGLG